MNQQHTFTDWRTSSRSDGGSNCIQVAIAADAVAIRDSKDPDGPILIFPRESWTQFLAAVRTDTFDT
jgi:hypothetical protein